jgi:cytochrome c
MRGNIVTKSLTAGSLALILSAGAANAAGDVKKGEKFFKKCKQCHTLEEGKKKIGPSLHQIIGKKAGTTPKFKYSQSYVDAGEKGLEWTPENLIAYLKNPKKWLAAFLEVKKVKSKMVVKYKKLTDRENVVAYLESLQKEEEMEKEEEAKAE